MQARYIAIVGRGYPCYYEASVGGSRYGCGSVAFTTTQGSLPDYTASRIEIDDPKILATVVTTHITIVGEAEPGQYITTVGGWRYGVGVLIVTAAKRLLPVNYLCR
ncbi:hypothetical protein GCM10023189_49500 [Nibrella saemangeumensis]|uniref:Uncharacterized protein n=1 Tax=Nibrella saemangeumensis TaxID=1084526 RepID=A0ABP8NI85_9BACT